MLGAYFCGIYARVFALYYSQRPDKKRKIPGHLMRAYIRRFLLTARCRTPQVLADSPLTGFCYRGRP